MKYIQILLLFFLFSLIASAQNKENTPDTLCYKIPSSPYQFKEDGKLFLDFKKLRYNLKLPAHMMGMLKSKGSFIKLEKNKYLLNADINTDSLPVSYKEITTGKSNSLEKIIFHFKGNYNNIAKPYSIRLTDSIYIPIPKNDTLILKKTLKVHKIFNKNNLSIDELLACDNCYDKRFDIIEYKNPIKSIRISRYSYYGSKTIFIKPTTNILHVFFEIKPDYMRTYNVVNDTVILSENYDCIKYKSLGSFYRCISSSYPANKTKTKHKQEYSIKKQSKNEEQDILYYKISSAHGQKAKKLSLDFTKLRYNFTLPTRKGMLKSKGSFIKLEKNKYLLNADINIDSLPVSYKEIITQKSNSLEKIIFHFKGNYDNEARPYGIRLTDSIYIPIPENDTLILKKPLKVHKIFNIDDFSSEEFLNCNTCDDGFYITEYKKPIKSLRIYKKGYYSSKTIFIKPTTNILHLYFEIKPNYMHTYNIVNDTIIISEHKDCVFWRGGLGHFFRYTPLSSSKNNKKGKLK